VGKGYSGGQTDEEQLEEVNQALASQTLGQQADKLALSTRMLRRTTEASGAGPAGSYARQTALFGATDKNLVDDAAAEVLKARTYADRNHTDATATVNRIYEERDERRAQNTRERNDYLIAHRVEGVMSEYAGSETMLSRQGYDRRAALYGVDRQFRRTVRGGVDYFDNMGPSDPEYMGTQRAFGESVTSANTQIDRNIAMGRVNLGYAVDVAGGASTYAANVRRIHRRFDAATVGMAPGSEGYEAAADESAGDIIGADRAYGFYNRRASLSQAGRRASLNQLMARNPAGAAVEELFYGARTNADAFLEENERGKAKGELDLGVLSLQNYSRAYTDAFRGQAIDTRLMAINNPKDITNPKQVLDLIGQKIDDLKQAIIDIGSD
jgi:hypothetical protein